MEKQGYPGQPYTQTRTATQPQYKVMYPGQIQTTNVHPQSTVIHPGMLNTNSRVVMAQNPMVLTTNNPAMLTQNRVMNTVQPQVIPLPSNIVIRPIEPPSTPIVSGFVVHPSGEQEKEDDKNDNKNNNEGTSESQQQQQLIPEFDQLLSTNKVPNIFSSDDFNNVKKYNQFDTVKFAKIVSFLAKSSATHFQSLKTKQENEQQAQLLHQSFWTFPLMERRIRGHNLDGESAIKVIQYKIATLNQTSVSALHDKFSYIHALLFGLVWQSLYEQTFFELELSRYVHDEVDFSDLHVVKDVFGTLCQLMIEYRDIISPHTAAVMRGLILYSGTHLLMLAKDTDSIPSASPSQSLLLEFLSPVPATDGSTLSSTGNQKSAESDVHIFIAQRLLEIDACFWSKSLLQPSINSKDWLSKTLLFSKDESSTPSSSSMIQEFDYLAILSQYPWRDLGQMNIEDVKNHILLPVQMCLEVLSKHKFLHATLFLIKALILVDEYFPELKLTCIGIMTRSPWPTKIVSLPCISLIRWESLPPDDLLLVFSEFYNLSGTSLEDYAKLPEKDRLIQIDTYAKYLVDNYLAIQQVYTLDKKIAAINKMNLFSIFQQFARLGDQFKFLKETGQVDFALDFTKLVVEELFLIAFYWIPSQSLMQTSSSSTHLLIPGIKQSCVNALTWLCNKDSYYLGMIINLIGQHLIILNTQLPNLINFLMSFSANVWNDWVPNSQTIDVISFLLTHKTFNSVTTSTTTTTSSRYGDDPEFNSSKLSMFNSYMAPSPVHLNPQIAAMAASFGCRLFGLIKWHIYDPISKIKALMILANSQKFVSNTWLNQVIRDLKPELFQGSIDFELSEAFATMSPKVGISINSNSGKVDLDNRIFVFVQILVAIGLVKDHYERKEQDMEQHQHLQIDSSRRSTSSSSTPYDVRWFIQNSYLDNFKKLFIPEFNISSDALFSKLYYILDVLKYDPGFESRLAVSSSNMMTSSNNAKPLSSLFETSKVSSNTNILLRMITRSMSTATSMKHFELWYTLWSNVLLSKLNNKALVTPINLFVHGLFCQQISFDYFGPILRQQPMNARDIVTNAASSPWVSFAALFGYEPRLPPARLNNNAEPPRGVKDSALWLWKEAAMNVQSPFIALAFWERFFLLYFEVQSLYGDLNYFPQTWKNDLNQTFTKLAKSLTDNKPVYLIYYSFTTWSKDIIFTTGNNLFTANNAEVLTLFLTQHKPIFPSTNPPEIIPPPIPLNMPAHNATENPLMTSGNVRLVSTINPTATNTMTSPVIMTNRPVTATTTPTQYPMMQTVRVPYSTLNTTLQPQQQVMQTTIIQDVDPPLTVLELFPNKVDLNMDYLKKDKIYFLAYKKELEQNVKCLQQYAKNIIQQLTVNFNLDHMQIPLVDDLLVFLSQYKEIATQLEELDDEFIDLSKKQYFNHKITFQSNDPNFIGEITTYQIGPQYPTVTNDMRSNRQRYNQQYLTLFDISRSISHAMSLTSYLKDDLIQGGNNMSGDQVTSNKLLAVALFFKLLPLILGDTISDTRRLNSNGDHHHHDDSIFSSLLDIVYDLGKKFISHQPELSQPYLLRYILEMSCKDQRSSSTTGKSAPHTISLIQKDEPSHITTTTSTSTSTTSTTSTTSLHTLPTLKHANTNLLDSSSSSSSSSGPQRREANNEEKKKKNRTRKELFSILTPVTFLNIESSLLPSSPSPSPSSSAGYPIYMQMLYLLASSTTNLDDNEMNHLSNLFEFDQSLPIIFQNYVELDLDLLFRTLKLCIAKSRLPKLSSVLIKNLIFYKFPENVGQTIETLLRHEEGESTSTNDKRMDWSDIVCGGNSIWPNMTSQQAFSSLQFIQSLSPISPVRFPIAVAMIKSLLLDTPLKQDFVEENKTVFVSPMLISSSNIWTVIENFIKTNLNTSSQPSESVFSGIMELISVIVHLSPTVVDRVWYLYTDSILPCLSATGDDNDQSVRDTLSMYLVSALTELPWDASTFHYNDTNSIDLMCKQLTSSLQPTATTIISSLFSKLDWIKYSNFVEEKTANLPEQDENGKRVFKYRGYNVTGFLYLYLSINLVSPSSVPKNIRHLLTGISNNPNWFMDNQYLFDWRQIPASMFVKYISNSMITLVKMPDLITSDPTPRLIENFQLLKDIVRLIGHPKVILSCIKEIHPFLFFFMASMEKDGWCWYLPFSEQIKLVSSYLVPLVEQYYITGKLQEKEPSEFSKAIVMFLRCAINNPDDDATDLNKNYYYSKFNYATFSTHLKNKDIKEFYEKLYGIVRQLCSSSTDTFSLTILRFITKALKKSPVVMCSLIEDTIRGYLNNAVPSSSQPPIHNCARALQVKGTFRDNLHVFRNAGPLSFRVLLEKEVQELKSSSDINNKENYYEYSKKFTQFICSIVEPILQFKPKKHRKFEVICLWLFLLECFNDESFDINTTQAMASVELFKLQLESSDMDFITKKLKITSRDFLDIESTEDGSFEDDSYHILYLASKALYIYLASIITSRCTVQRPDIKLEQDKASHKFFSLESDIKYSKYAPFFLSMQSISTTWSITEFEYSLLKHLLPIAPHLLRTVKLETKHVKILLSESGQIVDDNDNE
eukprot:TRINITY_DN2653_c0_g6_i1.p1 TRINITY_DN2653_c0_g6~~TRINITY_DN2653_c0_g6_i1.p1  ORF type:complete len:2577 (+),score=595.36 TRINITY_DN2653_c0_g6_i1:21-7751(+)